MSRSIIVGDDTFGKPVGQVGLEFCEKILRPTAFQTLNANDFGDYFFGLPVDCAAPDDLDVAVGADNDPNIEAALSYLDTGGCPAAARPRRAVQARGGTDPCRSWNSGARRHGSLRTRFSAYQPMERPPSTATIWPVT